MKVLAVNTSDTSGGAARAAYRIHEGVRALGVDSRIFVKSKGSQDPSVHVLSEFATNNPICKAYDWFYTKVKNKIQHAQWKPYKETRQKYFLSDLRGVDTHGALQKIEYDILHLHWLNNRFLDIRELSQIKKPIIWTLHDSWPFCGVCHIPLDCTKYHNHCGACPMLGSDMERDLAYGVFDKKLEAYRNLDLYIVTPSRWLAECAKHSALLGDFPISVIPNGIDTDVYQPLGRQLTAQLLGLNPDKKYILFGAMHATTDPNKGFDLLLQALHLLHVDDAELLVYGSDDALDKYALPLPVRSLGYLHGDKQMVMLYNVADVTIVPSRSENLSNTIMESMSCGTPVVAFNIGGNGDMIDHKQNGYLATEKDSADLANGIQWCLTHNINNALGIHARQKVLTNFTQDIVCRQYKSLYDETI